MSTDIENMLKNGKVPTLEQIQAMLLNGSADQIITGKEVKFHDDPARKDMVLPQNTGFDQAIATLERLREEQEEVTNFQRIYKYRVMDGVYAMTQVLKERYGVTLAKGAQSIFGASPAQTIEVEVGPGKYVTCPWGTIEIPMLKGSEIYLTGTTSENGSVFAAQFTGPRKHRPEAEKLFNAVDEYLKAHSIYRGKALLGSNELKFMDTTTFDARTVVYSDPVTEALENMLFGPIRKSSEFQAEGIPLRRALLFHGPYGTGKTSIAMLTAQVAEENGWTFLSARTTESIRDVMRTAALYQKCVVVVEDVEVATSGGSKRSISELLDIFDGPEAKGRDIILVLTTNHIDEIHKGLMRPGRIDATIKVAELDRSGVEKLIKAVVNPMKLADDVDYDVVYGAMDGFLPAFVRAAIDRAKTWALVAQGKDYVLDTAALKGAAASLHDQLRRMNDAAEHKDGPVMEEILRGLVTDVINRTMVSDEDGDFLDSERLGVVEGDVAPPRVQASRVR